jgi:hypothetical protein
VWREQLRQHDANAEEMQGKTATKGEEIGGSVKPKVGFGMFSRCFQEIWGQQVAASNSLCILHLVVL